MVTNLPAFFRSEREPTADDKARARAGLEKLFQAIDRYGEAHKIDPAEADAAIDAAVQEIRLQSS